jgi:phenylacetate-coenzyme A ligase PaaK-like adenylate-forming protein
MEHARSPMNDKASLLDAETLAARFVEVAVGALRGEDSGVERLRADLLSATMEHAWRFSEYYRSVLPDSVANGSFPLDGVSELPILTKAHIIKHSDKLRTCDSAGIVQYTSGTTAASIATYRTEDETRFLREFYTALHKLLHRSGPRPLILSLANLYHGSVIDVPLGGYRLATGVFDPVLLDQIMLWLTRPHNIPGVEPSISIITGLYHFLESLTYMLVERGFDFKACSVERLYAIGGLLTSRWRDLLTDIWSANVIPVYSLTEVFAYANQCLQCGSYHFLPHVVPELICPVEQTPVKEAAGELVLTGLFPFVQGQPMIRYATRDLFHLGKDRCPHGDSYTFLGRAEHSCILEISNERPTVIGSAVVQDILDNEPDVHTMPFFHDLPGVDSDAPIGKPDFTMTLGTAVDGSPRLQLMVQLRYNPRLYPERVAELKRTITRGMRTRIPGLDVALAKGSVAIDLTFRSPGGIEY